MYWFYNLIEQLSELVLFNNKLQHVDSHLAAMAVVFGQWLKEGFLTFYLTALACFEMKDSLSFIWPECLYNGYTVFSETDEID